MDVRAVFACIRSSHGEISIGLSFEQGRYVASICILLQLSVSVLIYCSLIQLAVVIYVYVGR